MSLSSVYVRLLGFFRVWPRFGLSIFVSLLAATPEDASPFPENTPGIPAIAAASKIRSDSPAPHM